jgi:hypothetical protein
MEGRPDVRLLARIDQADHCLVHVGCSSAMVRRTVRDRWADRRPRAAGQPSETVLAQAL